MGNPIYKYEFHELYFESCKLEKNYVINEI
jgi:hypothetical protein